MLSEDNWLATAVFVKRPKISSIFGDTCTRSVMGFGESQRAAEEGLSELDSTGVGPVPTRVASDPDAAISESSGLSLSTSPRREMMPSSWESAPFDASLVNCRVAPSAASPRRTPCHGPDGKVREREGVIRAAGRREAR